MANHVAVMRAKQRQSERTVLENGDKAPLSGAELKIVEFMIAVNDRLLAGGDALRERLKAIPNGWRDYRLMATTMDRMLSEIYPTVPMKGRLYLQKIIDHGEALIRYVPASRTAEWKVIRDDDLAVLINLAMSSECAICLKDGSELRKCELKHVLENMAPPMKGHPPGGCGYRNVVLGAELGKYMGRHGE